MRKGIKNYRSRAKPENTVAYIEELVVKRMKATQFFKTYEDGQVTAVIFNIPTEKGTLSFKLPARVEKVKKIVGNEEQARITAWANIRDWVDAQIALIETEQVKIEEVFLPYLTDQTGVTLYERMEAGEFKLPQLQEGKVL